MKIVIIQLSQTSHYFIPSRSKYFPQYPALEHPQSLLFPQQTVIQKERGKIIVPDILILTYPDSIREDFQPNGGISRI
jgi:hypothetical protein